MEDILNEIITLSEKNRVGKNKKGEEKEKEEEEEEEKEKYEKQEVKTQHEKQRKATVDRILSQKKNAFTSYSSNSSCNSVSNFNGSNSTHNDASTCCTVDDINIEKANIFSKIIKEKKGREDSDIFIDLEKNIDEKTPLFQNENNMNSYLIDVNQINNSISNIYKNIDKINVIKKKIDLNIYDNEKLYKKVNVIIDQSEQIVEQIKKKN